MPGSDRRRPKASRHCGGQSQVTAQERRTHKAQLGSSAPPRPPPFGLGLRRRCSSAFLFSLSTAFLSVCFLTRKVDIAGAIRAPPLDRPSFSNSADSQEGVEPGSPCASSIAVTRRISFSYRTSDAQVNGSIVAKTSAISHSAPCSWYDRSRAPMLLSETQVPRPGACIDRTARMAPGGPNPGPAGTSTAPDSGRRSPEGSC